jgi:hypothetical protein
MYRDRCVSELSNFFGIFHGLELAVSPLGTARANLRARISALEPRPAGRPCAESQKNAGFRLLFAVFSDNPSRLFRPFARRCAIMVTTKVTLRRAHHTLNFVGRQENAEQACVWSHSRCGCILLVGMLVLPPHRPVFRNRLPLPYRRSERPIQTRPGPQACHCWRNAPSQPASGQPSCKPARNASPAGPGTANADPADFRSANRPSLRLQPALSQASLRRPKVRKLTALVPHSF